MPVTSSASGIKAGTVAHFAASAAPAGWLKANGAAVSRSLYAALFGAIGITYGAGDGATTFLVPDLRGEFLRGLDDGRGVDAARVLGSAQMDELKSHTHSGAVGNTIQAGSGALGATSTNQTGATGGTETRPRNVALLACIKY